VERFHFLRVDLFAHANMSPGLITTKMVASGEFDETRPVRELQDFASMVEYLYDVREWKIFLVSITLQLATLSISWRLGRRARKKDDRESSVLGILQASVAGLLALMAGFTFSMVLTRFESRKLALLAQASAIGTVALRAEFLPKPQFNEMMDLLRDYARTTITFGRSYGHDWNQFNESRRQIDELHRRMWRLTAKAQNPQSIASGLFTQSMNEMLDAHETRLAALRNHAPEVVLLLLHLIAIVSMGFAGYVSGHSGERHVFANTTVCLLITVVILIITDLDRPQLGLIIIGDQPMVDVQSLLAQ
jgi:hypothetical protein